MKFLAIWGSPRRGGNTEILLNAFIDGAAGAGADVDRIALRDLKISPCQEIYHCFKDGTCPIKDDMLPLYDKLLEADVVVLASPIFFYSVSAQAKVFIDRTQALWARRYRAGLDFPGPHRQGVFLAVAATHGKLLFVGARLVTRYFFDAINVSYAAEILVRGVDDKGDILRQPDVLSAATDLGRRLAQGEKIGPVKFSHLAV